MVIPVIVEELLAAFVMRMTLGEKEMRDGSGWSPMSQN
jgi:hypothetical protein